MTSRVTTALNPGGRRARSFRQAASITCAFIISACSGKTDAKADSGAVVGQESAVADAGTTDAAPRTNVAVSIETVGSEPFSELVTGTGVVSARTGHFAALAAPAPVRITAVHVAMGDHVREGQKLVSFEATSFDAALSTADAALTAAEQASARASRLVDAGVSPRKDLESANAELAMARANAATAKRAQQLAQLHSPISGVVTRLNAVLGANADATQTLVEISDTRSLDLLLVLSPALAAGVHTGQAVTVRDAANATASMAEGTIADVSAVVDSESRGVVVRVAIGKQHRTVRIGETLSGQVVIGTHTDAIVISDDALVPTGEGFQVFVVDGEHRAHARRVTVGGRDGHRVWIRDGLKAGEKIVTAGAFGIDDGNTVVETAPPHGQKSP